METERGKNRVEGWDGEEEEGAREGEMRLLSVRMLVYIYIYIYISIGVSCQGSKPICTRSK